MATVTQRGTDTSGRPIRASREMWAVWDACCAELGFEPTIVQGGFMGADGASQSAGTHDGDAFDVRLWDRTDSERAAMIRVFRRHAIAYWERDESQGFDLHAHMLPGPWAHPAPGALYQWHDYLNSRNGLASHGPDYHWRPSPLVTEPPEDDMFSDDDRAALNATRDAVAKLAADEKARAQATRDRDRRLAKGLRVAVRNTSAEVRAEVERLADELEQG